MVSSARSRWSSATAPAQKFVLRSACVLRSVACRFFALREIFERSTTANLIRHVERDREDGVHIGARTANGLTREIEDHLS
jgi:hypothetical protein